MAKNVQNMLKIALEGDKELKNLCAQLPTRITKRAFRPALAAAATVVLKAARQNVPRKHGFLKKSLGKKIKTYPSGNVAAIIGARRSITGTADGKRHVPANYFHLVEGGTKPHAQKRGQHPGSKAQPFLRKAYEQTRSQVSALVSSKVRSELIKQAMKLGKK